ncbi:hypothetical protein FRB94_005405 [Tulasnella sp. JGI-2019a]|nr:hypothetical protein FRB94_005405 [Tulasnella sp. JGI-2019a]
MSLGLLNFGKVALRAAKHYSNGYSDAQVKVRNATTNDPWGPFETQMNEIAQMTFNQQEFLGIMATLNERLNDKGQDWRRVFKALTVLDYCLHAGSDNVARYFWDSLYTIERLKDFRYIDKHMQDQGAGVRQKAGDISNLLIDEGRLRDHRRSRVHMMDRMVDCEWVVGNEDGENKDVHRQSLSMFPPVSLTNGQPNKDEDGEAKSLELNKRSLEESAQDGWSTTE